MTIEIKKNAEATIIEITGRLDTITAPALDKAISEDIGDTGRNVTTGFATLLDNRSRGSFDCFCSFGIFNFFSHDI